MNNNIDIIEKQIKEKLRIVKNALIRDFDKKLKDLTPKEKEECLGKLLCDPHIIRVGDELHYIARTEKKAFDHPILNQFLSEQKHMFADTEFRIGTKVFKNIYVVNYSDNLIKNFIDDLINLNIAYDMIQRFSIMSKLDIKNYLKLEEDKLQEQVLNQKINSQDYSATKEKLEIIEYKIQQIKDPNVQYFNYALTFIINAPDIDKLDSDILTLNTALKTNKMFPKSPNYHHKKAYIQNTIFGKNIEWRYSKGLTTKHLAHNFPFIN